MSVRAELSADELADYRREGCTHIPGLLSGPELSHVREAFDELPSNNGYVVDKFAKRLVVTRNLWQRNASLELIVRQLGVLVARLMGQEQVRLLDDFAVIKPAQEYGGDPTSWHQDAPNFPFDRRGFLVIWMAVDDISLDQGPLTLLPGSHRLGLLGAMDGAEEGDTLDVLLTNEDRSYVRDPLTKPMAAGDASVHDGSLLHSAGANQTSRPRRAWAIRYIPASTLYTGAAHRFFDNLGLVPFEPFEHDNFPLLNAV
jgi:ectoine hydroxylase-related dioxygenase (phytanoyl-CoA dioxygenase family)